VRTYECFEVFADAKAYKESGLTDITPVDRGMTLGEVWKHFKEVSLKNVESSTKSKLISQCQHLEPHFGIYMKDLTPFKVDEILSYWKEPDYLAENKHTRVSFKNELALLKQLTNFYRSRFDFQYGHPVLPEHWKHCVVRAQGKKPSKDLSTREFGKFLFALKARTAGGPLEVIHTMAEVQYAIYGRIQEVAAIHYEDFDPKTGWIVLNKKIIYPRVKGEAPIIKSGLKASEEKRIKSPFTARILQEWCLKKNIRSGLVFSLNKEVIPYRSIQFQYDKAFEEAGFHHRGTHTLRHAALTEHYSISGDIYKTMQAAGHTDVSTTQIYASHREENLSATQEILERKLLALRDEVG